jgi:PhnB protein
MAGNVKAVPDGYHAVTPYLIVAGAARAIEFYKQAFGATERMRMERQGKVGHAELQIGDSCVMLADEFPEMNIRAPQAGGGSAVSIHLYIAGVDDVVKRAVDLGATLKRPIEDQFYGDRMGTIVDPFGHTWHVSTHIEDVTPEEMRKRMAAMGAT